MAYEIWLSYNNGEEEFQIPVNPSALEVRDSSNGTTYDVMGSGMVNVIKGRSLTEYSFSSFFPGYNLRELQGKSTGGLSFLSNSALVPPMTAKGEKKGYINYIQEWMDKKRPIRFKYLGGAFELNEAVSIEAFDWKEVAGSSGDVEYTLKLKKYVFYQALVAYPNLDATDANNNQIQMDQPVRSDERETPLTYTLVAGDTLWAIAKSLLGDGNRWAEIQRLNGITDAEVKRLPIGRVLKLPEVK